MTTPPMLRQLRHDVWATKRLIQHCRSLTVDQLALTIPGTYGTIRRTLAHIVRADEGYLSGFGLVAEPFLEVGDATALDEIASRHAKVGEAVEGFFARGEFDPDRVMRSERRRADLEPWVLLTQFAHHGSDHRAHICSILGANGLAVPDLDVWAYGRGVGAFRTTT